MTMAQIEQRLSALEQTVSQIRVQLSRQAESENGDEEIISDSEYDLTTTLVPHATMYFPAKFVEVECPPSVLGLSEEEWASLPLDDEDV